MWMSMVPALRASGFVVVLSKMPCAQTARAAFDEAVNLFNQKYRADAAAASQSVERARTGRTDRLLPEGKRVKGMGRYPAAGVRLQQYPAGRPGSQDAGYLAACDRFREGKGKEPFELFTAAAGLMYTWNRVRRGSCLR